MMDGSSFEDDLAFTSQGTVVLVGRKGNGKNATGNTILGAKLFQRLNVIDTPGLFDSSVDSEYIAKEIISCTNRAEDGIHAFLVVLSVRSRYSKEEEAAISSLLSLFGRKMYDYMIIVFTGGDLLSEDDETLEGYLNDCPETLKETLRLCGNRCVLFDNKTEDQTKRSDQVQKLLSLINMVSNSTDGRPYLNEKFSELKKETEQVEKFLVLKETKRDFNTKEEISLLPEQMQIVQLVPPKLRETTLSLEKQLADERIARVKDEENVKAAQKKSDEEKRQMLMKIDMALSRQEEFRRKPMALSREDELRRKLGIYNICAIM